MKSNVLRSTVGKIRMTEACKRRIIVACRSEVECENVQRRFTLKKAALLAACAIIVITSTVTVMAKAGFLSLPVYNKPHLQDDNVDINWGHNSEVKDTASEYIMTCNGVAGDRDNVYFDFTVKRADGGVIASTVNGEKIVRYDAFNAYLEFEDGHKKEVSFLMLEDSNDYEYHLEGMSLFYDKEKQYLGQEAKVFIEGIVVTLENGEQRPVCEFDEAVVLTIDVDETLRTVYFDKDEFSLYNGGIVITSATIEGAKITLYGECNVDGTLYGLQETVAKAYVVCDGESIALGGKTDCGTLPDGRFTIQWLVETVISPNMISALCIDGKTIMID